jgi:hypothetical protein
MNPFCVLTIFEELQHSRCAFMILLLDLKFHFARNSLPWSTDKI